MVEGGSILVRRDMDSLRILDFQNISLAYTHISYVHSATENNVNISFSEIEKQKY